MIKLENCEVVGWEHAIRGMRNPKNSWDKSDSIFDGKFSYGLLENVPVSIGPNDHKLMMQLASGGPVHAKYRRMITVYVDITAPLYWWKEFDTYKVGTVANSCSTMHKIHDKEFTLEDFSYEHLIYDEPIPCRDFSARQSLLVQMEILNMYRELFIETKDKKYWWQMIQLLPTSYNQKRTVQLNYEVLVGMYRWRKDHKLDEWREFCKWIESLPYSEIITGGKEE
jgi:hypothetical protein